MIGLSLVFPNPFLGQMAIIGFASNASSKVPTTENTTPLETPKNFSLFPEFEKVCAYTQ